MSSSVNCLLIFKGTLYAGTWNDVWAWNGASWSLVDKVGSSPSTRTLYNVISLVDKDGTIYAGTDNGVWMWDDSSWETVGNTSLAVHDGSEISNLYVSDGTLYASTFGGVLSWDGTSWNKVGSFTGSIANPLTIFQLSSSQGNLYAGTTYGVYEWDGSSWSSISEFNGNKTIDPSILASSFGVNLTTAPTTFRNQTLISSILITPDGILYAGVAGGGVWAAPLQTLNQTAVNHEPISNNTTEPTTAEGPGCPKSNDDCYRCTRPSSDSPCRNWHSDSFINDREKKKIKFSRSFIHYLPKFNMH